MGGGVLETKEAFPSQTRELLRSPFVLAVDCKSDLLSVFLFGRCSTVRVPHPLKMRDK